MANTKSAIKRSIQEKKRYERNSSERSSFRTSIKKLLNAIAQNEALENIQALYQKVVKKIDQTAQKGLIHKNKAARYKSRLNTKVKNLSNS